MFTEEKLSEKVILVHIYFSGNQTQEDLAEFELLASSTGIEPIEIITGSRAKPAAKFFIGKGKAEEICDVVTANKADLVIFNHELAPAQERNLERLFKCRVLDRTGLILDIFAQRARTFEGKLQVELAQLQHLSTRLVRGWTHLERQKGGIGLRGPGETQLETDRRLLNGRIKNINARLAKVRSQRNQSRAARQKAAVPVISLVGYTNAGKSSLFNQLTEANVLVMNKLFATLDPSLRRFDVRDVGPVVLADTVGFIRHLPHDLVNAFRATLDEIREADLLLHIVDASDPERHTKIEQVELVLKEIDADTVPQLQIYNKIDLLQDSDPRADMDEQGLPWRVWLSAQEKSGLDLLDKAISQCLNKGKIQRTLLLPPTQADLRAKLYEQKLVRGEEIDEQGNFILRVQLSVSEYKYWCKKLKLED